MNSNNLVTVIALILIILCGGWLLLTAIGVIFSALLFAITYPLASLMILGGLFVTATLMVKLFKL